MRRLWVLSVLLASGVVAVEPGVAFAQFERGPQPAPRGAGAGVVSSGDEPGVALPPETTMPGEPRAVAPPAPAPPKFYGGPEPSPPPPRTVTPSPPQYRGGPEPSPPAPRTVTPSPPQFYGGPEPLPPGQRPPWTTPPPPYRRPEPTPPGGRIRQPLPPRVSPQPPPSWPIRRPWRPVILHRRYDYERVEVRLFLPPVFFGGIMIDDRRGYGYGYGGYQRDRLTWSDSVYFYADEGWAEFVLDCNAWGERLWIEVREGRARFEWAEVVFNNGESQVVDFSGRSLGPGLYPLLDFRGGRRVDHVRMVAQAATRAVEIILRMEQ